jgi:riboflavin kinase / FMN adenylyltransferase
MEIIRHGIHDLKPQLAGALTIGSFDGIHVGHRQLLERLFATAKASEMTSTLVTFSPHPRFVLGGKFSSMGLLADAEERIDLLRDIGLDRLVVLNFTPELAALEAREFIRDVLIQHIGCKHLLIGYNHAFGKNRSGNRDTLTKLASELNFDLDILPPVEAEGSPISSTRIRRTLEEGDIELAARLLGRPYSLLGSVVRGHSRGAEIGYPTANLRLRTPEKMLPASGVYAVTGQLSERGRPVFPLLQGMMNLGARPTFNETEVVPEVHFFDFDETIYGLDLKLAIHHRVRDIMRFDSKDKLVAQLKKDYSSIQDWFVGRARLQD